MTLFPMMRITHLFPLLLAALALAAAAAAQSVRWEPPAGTLAASQASELALVFENCSPDGDFTLPDVPGLQFGHPSQRTETSVINFQMTQRVAFVYPVMLTGRDPVSIPAFSVATNKGRLQVSATHYEVGEATVGSSGVSIDRVAGAQFSANPSNLWAGQLFDLRYKLLISRRFNPTNVGNLDWNAPAGLALDNWAKPENISENVGDDARVGIALHARACALNPGPLVLPPSKEPIELQVGQEGWGLLSRPAVEQYLVTGTAPTLQVQPLPAPAPADFHKAVGQFSFESKVVPTAVTVGEPITWTLSLHGTGNWPAELTLPSREVSRDFTVIGPKEQRTMKEGTIFEGTLTEDVVLIPTQPGTYTLGAVSYSYFDPQTGVYRTVRTAPVTVKVAPAAPATASPAPLDRQGAPVFHFTPEPAEAAAAKSPAPTLPGRLPLDPLPGSARSCRPAARLAPWLLGAPLVPLALLGLVLGVRRALRTDPRRDRRTALRALPAVLARLRTTAAPADSAAAVRDWQRLTARLWAADSVNPAPDVLAAAIQRAQPAADSNSWVQLWREADAFLFGRPSAQLPGDWPDRAAAALRSVRLPPRPFLAGLRPSNLWPAAVVLALVLLAPPAAAEPTAGEAYRNGDFAAAEQGWRAVLAAQPGDWKARHNLGLALAQQNRWSEAAAHWGAAYLAAPRQPVLRWDLATGLAKAEFTQPELAVFADGAGLAAFARFASPAEWQEAIVAGSLVIGLGLALVLVDRHGGRRRWRRVLASVLVCSGLAGMAGGYLAVHTYGPLAQPDAVLVWHVTELRSIPTEAGEQKTEPLAAGTIARATRSFLDWEQLAFPNGQTGWVRRGNLVRLYP